MKEVSVAVVGATGAVGNEMVKVLEERRFPVNELRLLASKRSVGKKISFNGNEVKVEELTEDSFKGVQISLFSAGASVSKKFAPIAAKSGCVVIDNSSAFRMEADIPLVVPEVNPHAIAQYKNRGIIANPNCSTIQMVVALKPIHDVSKIKRVVVATYQAVSGTGKKAIEELSSQTQAIFNFKDIVCNVYPHQIAFNCLPHIDVFLENGYTREEMKMYYETKKIMEDEDIEVTATCVRVPVFYGHSEAINIELEKKLTADEVRKILSNAPGVKVVDNPDNNEYPLAIYAAGRDEVFVGRIREDVSKENCIEMWVVSDNIRKGAALNAVQIAEVLLERYL
ncbi:MAG: aspartate-semialdehyde dehydrogenase [Deltaproteobacteria bacterium]|nr:aspartate-semialdehyde dehydrogenase [Deltaproteobacteria bacterium]